MWKIYNFHGYTQYVMADSNIDNRGGVQFGTPCLGNCDVWIVREGCGHPDGCTDGWDYSNVFR